MILHRPLAVLPLVLTLASVPAGAADDRLATGAVSILPALGFTSGTTAASREDLAAGKEAIALIERGRGGEADQLAATIRDPVVRKTVEWMRLRRDSEGLGLARYTAFIDSSPGWPSLGMLRRRAEGQLWENKADARTVRAYFGAGRPVSGKGKLALARVLLEAGDRAGAQALVRAAWREDQLSKDVEDDVLKAFPDMLTRADHKARADLFLYAEEGDEALRNARRAGADMVAVARARIAAIRKDKALGKLLEAVPQAARGEPSYIYARSQFHRREEQGKVAAEWLLRAPSDPKLLGDTDQWWMERRLVVRRLLDEGDPKTAYRVAATAPVPERDNYRAEREFLAGWVALRFLDDPAMARPHMARIAQGITSSPWAHARAFYWQGRTAEAAGDKAAARTAYDKAARITSTYYGQLARARLGMTDLPVRPLPVPSAQARAAFNASEPGRAIRILYEMDRADLTVLFYADIPERMDPEQLAALAEMTVQRKDARAMLLVGRAGLNRGLPFETVAFPNVGLPDFRQVGPEADDAVVYAIARQESAFNPRTVSTANALGYMQVTPAAGRYVAKKFNIAFNEKRLLSDPVYNMQMGAAEIGDLIADYGNYILAFAGYNAGRGRVRDWIERYGDPRDPNVDPVDWIERIPFFETRNYVQRVLENLQIYRVRFSGRSALRIEADLRATR